jgi:hypothetical protein
MNITSIQINDGSGWQKLEVDGVSVVMVDTPKNRELPPKVIGPYEFELKILRPPRNTFQNKMYRIIRRGEGRDKRWARRNRRKL